MTATNSTQAEDLRVIIAGAGRVGHRTARVLEDYGHDAYLIDLDPEAVAGAKEMLQSTVIEGDATDPDVLAQADPERADVLAALTEKGPTNFAVCAEAKHFNDEIQAVARIEHPDGLDTEEEFVDRVVYPERAGAKAAINQILGDDVRALEDVASGLDVLEVRVDSGAPAAGERLDTVQFPDRGHIVFDITDGEVPRPDTRLQPGHRYLVAARPGIVDTAKRLLTG
ncbi:potassium channel family protein [Salinibacter altiplanensis]|uniref:potassium channel family protein n=1 Tax=Salinibacter altiplanensis TaxID=1803181 RepID=UPI000C9FD6CB|nr:TrkA family potassium uptake protein [Salinibacter altiplanensis]